MRVHGFNADARFRYDGPEFEEYCISEGKYLQASRDRTPCLTCPLGKLCDAGFQEQVRLVANGENPSLTDCKVFPDEVLSERRLLEGLDPEQKLFVLRHVFHEPKEDNDGK